MPVPTSAQRHKLDRDPITDAHIVLLEFQEDGRSTVTRYALNTEDVVSGGNTYRRASVRVDLPSTGSDDTRATLTASNLDRTLGRVVDAARRRVTVRLMLVDSSDPDTVIIDTKNLIVMSTISGNSVQVTASLEPRMSLQEPVPFQRTTRKFFPGVWLS